MGGGMGGPGGPHRRPEETAAEEGSGDGGHSGPSRPTININFKKHGKRFWITWAIVAVVVIGFCYWWFHPSLNIHSADLWWFVGIFLCVPAFLIFRSLYNSNQAKAEVNIDRQKKATRFKRLSWIPVIVILVGILGAFASSTFFPFNAARYSAVLHTDEYDFASDIPEVDYSQIPVIDHDSAVILGNRAMGTIPDYVSQFEISDLYSQINYHDTPVRVSPLGYADFFKWITNRTPGIPAYVLVDMTTQNTQIVRLNEAMKYTQSEPFARNIDRYVQLKYPFYMFEQLAFEIDEEGHPWWICPVQTRTIGLFGGETIERVVLVDACTGECQDMRVEDVPEWVDRAYPSDLLITQYNWWGRYHNGWWNSFIGQRDVRQTTPGTDGKLGYNYLAKDDDVWVYTGVTSATADNSIIGFVLINQRTQDSHYYPVAGATEDSAMDSAEGQVQNLRYTAAFPLLINVEGQPTYFLALKDGAGLVKKYAMIDIQRYQNVAIGDTVSATQTSYEELLASNGVLSPEEVSATDEVSGTVEAVAQAVIDGNSHFYLTLSGDPSIYDCALPSLIQAITVKPGDQVTLAYTGTGSLRTVTGITTDGAQLSAGTQGEAAAQTQTGADTAASAAGTTSQDQASEADASSSAQSTGGVSVTTEGASLKSAV